MFFLLLLLIIGGTVAKETKALVPVICDGIIFEHKYYEKQILFGDLNTPRNLVMHMYSGELFFTHKVQKDTKMELVIRVCDVEKRTCKDLTDVPGGLSITYENSHHDVFFGSRDGIYKYVRASQTATYIAARGTRIRDLFIRQQLYYIDNATKTLSINMKGRFKVVNKFQNIKMDRFLISNNRAVYFSNSTGLYRTTRVNKHETLVLNATIRQIVQRYKSNRVYVATSDGIYFIEDDAPEIKAQKAAQIEQVFGMAFRNTTQSEKETLQIIYSDNNAIYKLTLSVQGDVCLEERKKLRQYLARQSSRSGKKMKKVLHKG